MKRKSRKLLALILCAGMLMPLFSGVASAEEGGAQGVDESTDPANPGGSAVVQNADPVPQNVTLAETPVIDEATLLEALTAGGTVTLGESFALTADATIGTDVVLDLNGKTLTTGSYSLKIAGGDLTIQDTAGNGKITGTDYIVDMMTAGGDTVTLESGILEGTGWTAAVRIASEDLFYMTGGTVRQMQSNVQSVLAVNAGGTAEVTGGRIEGGIRGISAAAASSKIIVGEVPAGAAQTEEEAGKVYVSSVYASNAGAGVTLNSGTVGRVFGNVGTGFVLNCWFEQDVSGYLPAGMTCSNVDGHWVVEQLNEQNAAARIGDVYYASPVKAAAELQDGETLVLLRDYVGTGSVKIQADTAVIDLNGYDITNTASGGYGLEITSDSDLAAGETGIVICNSGADTAAITAAVPVHAHSGNSLKALPITLEDGIMLVSTEEGGTQIELGTAAYIEYSEETAGYITVGGFLSTHSDGKQYIHGSFTQAAENDVNKTAVLLNDYTGSISLSSEDSLTLDLNKNTVTSSGTAVIRVNADNASLTIKNGTMITENGSGAEVGIPADGGIGGLVIYNNVTLNLENVDLTANGTEADDYGIVCNGQSSGININLKGGSVAAPNVVGIYFPAKDSTLNIDGTKIAGTMGVAVKGGTVTVKNGTEISGTGAENIPDAGVSSGVNNTGAALYVEGNYTDREIKVNILGGTFQSEHGEAVQMLFAEETGAGREITVTGGTFSDDSAEPYLAPGASLGEPDGDGNYTVTAHYVAEIDGQQYVNLADAIADADGRTVRLLDNIETAETIEITGTDITLDLNGRTISGEIRSDGLIKAMPGTSLTITDSARDKGRIVNSAASLPYGVYVDENASVILDGGVILNDEGGSTSGAAVYMDSNDTAPPRLTVKDATLTSAKGYAVRLRSSFYSGYVTIEGGRFETPGKTETTSVINGSNTPVADYITISGGTFTNWNATTSNACLAEGCSISVDENNSVSIVKEAPASAAASATRGDVTGYLTGGDLYNLIQRLGIISQDSSFEIFSDVTLTYPEDSGFGLDNETAAIPMVTLNIAPGAELSGNMYLKVADVAVTGEGAVADDFFLPVNEDFTVGQTGNIIQGRLADSAVVATAAVDGNTYRYTDFTSAWSLVSGSGTSDCVITLYQDISASYGRSISTANLTLDLNGHTYTFTSRSSSGNAFTVNYDKTFTIVDHSENGGGRITSTYDNINSLLLTGRTSDGAVISIAEGVTVEGPVLILGKNATLDVYGTINTENRGSAAVYNNGADTENSIMNLYDGAVVKGDHHGIYHPGTGTLNVYGGSAVEADSVGIEIRKGTLNVYEEAVITGGSDGETTSTPNGSGTTTQNAAVAVAQHGNSTDPVVVNVYGGTLTGASSVYESNPHQNETQYTDLIELNLRDGNYVGSVYSETQTGFISGGTFTEEPENGDIYPGLQAVQEGGSGNFIIERLQDVYVNGISGDDTNNGTDAENAVQTLERALKLAADDGTIYVCGTVTVDSGLTVDGAKIERADGFDGVLISVDGANAVMTLKNTSIDGKDETVSYGSYLVFITNGGTLNIESGTEIINNKTTAVYVNNRSYLYMAGGAIRDNERINPTADGFYDGGAGIYNCGTTEISGGEISGNTVTEYGGGGILNGRGTVTLRGSAVVKGNSASWGGGIATLGAQTILSENASIEGNISQHNGAGVYLEGYSNFENTPSVFEMTGGSITGNEVTANGWGAGIFGYHVEGETVVRISGGTIANNQSSYDGKAIALGGDFEPYAGLELSGTPSISGDVYLIDTENASPIITVKEDFNPAAPIAVNALNGKNGMVAVSYPASMTAAEAEALFASTNESRILTETGSDNTLEWFDLVKVSFMAADGTTTYKTVYVRPGARINASDAPAESEITAPAGYEFSHWRQDGQTAAWNFETDSVPADTTEMELYVAWNLKAPTVEVKAETTTLQGGASITLTAVPSHDLSTVTYTYQWYKDGTPIEGAVGATLTVSESGSYTVRVKAGDGVEESAESESAPVVITAGGQVSEPAGTSPTDTPPTGDNSSMLLWLILCIAAAGTMAGTFACKRYARKEK
ncbi:PKD domain-containing protein [Clostridium sp. Marseille-P3244]|uniref:PKD domain-containing protein n=1 Tax=Clostridium sp. Marseille-P3244 TaxID=1871020 RepID=UPI0009305B94|nr:PKD domain-containing protein [Clostridium sp. Marseille-P3244]